MPVTLDDERRGYMVGRLRGFFLDEFDEDLSAFRAESLIDFFLESLGPSVYNQGVEDARAYMIQKLDDLDAEIHEPEAT